MFTGPQGKRPEDRRFLRLFIPGHEYPVDHDSLSLVRHRVDDLEKPFARGLVCHALIDREFDLRVVVTGFRIELSKLSLTVADLRARKIRSFQFRKLYLEDVVRES